MMLPDKKTTIKKELWEYHWLVYGSPKVGKSSFVSEFNDPLFLATEDRLKHLNVFKMPEEGAIKNWSEFQVICKEIVGAIKEDKFRWKTIVIDTVDNLFKFCSDHVCKQNQMDHPSDKEYGKGWGMVNDEFFRYINGLCNLGKSVIFISHSQEKEIKERNREYTKTVPTLPNGAWKVIMPIVDIIGHIGFDSKEPQKRLLYTRGSEFLTAGCAISTPLPAEIELNYKEIEKAFKKGAKS